MPGLLSHHQLRQPPNTPNTHGERFKHTTRRNLSLPLTSHMSQLSYTRHVFGWVSRKKPAVGPTAAGGVCSNKARITQRDSSPRKSHRQLRQPPILPTHTERGPTRNTTELVISPNVTHVPTETRLGRSVRRCRQYRRRPTDGVPIITQRADGKDFFFCGGTTAICRTNMYHPSSGLTMYYTLKTLQAVNIITNKHLPVLLVALPVPALSLCMCVRLPTFFSSCCLLCMHTTTVHLVGAACCCSAPLQSQASLAWQTREVSAYIPTGYVTIQ